MGDMLTRDSFLRNLILKLAESLEDVVGPEDAEGYVSIVGAQIGEEINALYTHEKATERFDRQQVAEVLVDLKRRINGDFFIVDVNEDEIVLGNRTCPFGASVEGKQSLCMMTSNVFGTIASEHLGYARVHLPETIAAGCKECRVVVSLRKGEGPGREYYRVSDE